ncbi:hypothetical protein [Flavimaricola marinus]|uniref:Uncharacterized protein n=1 Tax=Flavimaricola marinus TaxID=1819565 RepID=A0A238L8I9_9RHOB|nr:hypothetical protein [Flavimaricola marinus]SMY05999.1 hypothetical protein LOM8899_00120 [Flavimaricola marinus]
MTFYALRRAASAAIRPALPLAIAGALALSACVPIPIPQGTRFLPNPADLIATDTGDFNVCGYDSGTTSQGYRDIGTVRVIASFFAPDDRTDANASTSAGLTLTLVELSGDVPSEGFAVNPALIRLEEAGRSYPVAEFSDSEQRVKSSGTGQIFSLQFPAGTGVDDAARIVFEAGAILRDGQPVALEQLRFQRRATMSVYMFPCIPS